MPSPLFQFFEMIAEELTLEESRVLTVADFDPAGDDASVLDDLRKQLGVMTNDEAMKEGVKRLREHFEARGSQLPFTYDEVSGRFKAADHEYLKFVTEIREIRGQGKNSKTFEVGVMERMKARVTGALHRVGHPRTKCRKATQFNKYLADNLGFDGYVPLGSKEKDGGFDILWALPLGALPHRPLVSVQCKNGVYRLKDADASCGPSKRSLGQHSGLLADVHVMCVLFNDYITNDVLPKKAMQFVPLGLSDLGALSATVTAAAL